MRKVIVNTTRLDRENIEFSTYTTGLIPDSKRVENNVINVYPNKEYQIIEGFGAGLTEAAGYALSKMSKKKLWVNR